MNQDTKQQSHTDIYKVSEGGEFLVGSIDPDGVVFSQPQGVLVGRVEPTGHVFRKTQFGERDLGSFTRNGLVRSSGLFEGGDLGWVDADGTVIQAGLILGEEVVGRIVGDQLAAGGAALLLLFLPDDDENTRRTNR